MEPEFKARVVDRSGQELGTVDHLVRDTWSGEIRKFVVRRPDPDKDLFISMSDVAEAGKGRVKLNVSLEELNSR
jgi:sporulation protein YlmC with PRC-barrel domain